MTNEQQDAVQRITANLWGVGGYIGPSGRMSDVCNEHGFDKVMGDARIVVGALSEMGAEARFWKRMFMRQWCGCLSLDCRHHGAYVPEEYERVEAAQSEHLNELRKAESV